MIQMLFVRNQSDIKTTLCCLLMGSVLNLAGCASADKKDETDNTNMAGNDFPTQVRVEYVLQCMKKHGSQSYDTLYPCVCSIDKIASQMNYQDYDGALVFANMKSTPGEAGSLFRDPPQSEELRDRLEKAEKLAEESCYVKR